MHKLFFDVFCVGSDGAADDDAGVSLKSAGGGATRKPSLPESHRAIFIGSGSMQAATIPSLPTPSFVALGAAVASLGVDDIHYELCVLGGVV